jgi:hypothetical protein
MNRPLNTEERELLVWLLEHGEPAAADHIHDVSLLRVTAECPCGCASIDLAVEGSSPDPSASMEIVSDYLWTSEQGGENGVFVFLKNGSLSGMEVWSADGKEPPRLPRTDQLRAWSEGQRDA